MESTSKTWQQSKEKPKGPEFSTTLGFVALSFLLVFLGIKLDSVKLIPFFLYLFAGFAAFIGCRNGVRWGMKHHDYDGSLQFYNWILVGLGGAILILTPFFISVIGRWNPGD